MKWGHAYEINGPEKLLYLVFSWILAQSSPIDNWLKNILTIGGGLSGDPGWEVEHIPSDVGPGIYRVWADPEMSGIEPAEVIYSADAVRNALRVLLLAFGETYPEKKTKPKKC